MTLRDFDNLPYVPLLSVRPAEMRALKELPERDKDLLLPHFLLRPWVGSNYLQSSIEKLIDAYGGDRPAIIDLAEPEQRGARRPVHDELRLISEPDDGFANWCAYVERHGNFIPTLQLGDLDEIELQAGRLLELDRGLVVRFPRQTLLSASRLYAQRLGRISDGGDGLLFVLDYERSNADLLLHQTEATGLARGVLESAPRAHVAISATSFPDSFGNVDDQDIYERQLFNGVRRAVGGDQLVYSDRGSARAERQAGGGGPVYPRIDYALPGNWQFYRSEDASDDAAARPQVYTELAQEVMDDEEAWDAGLRLWGTQMIERTSLGDPDAITSPARATATRINIHLHRQLFFDDPDGLYETDEDWSD